MYMYVLEVTWLRELYNVYNNLLASHFNSIYITSYRRTERYAITIYTPQNKHLFVPITT